MRGIDSSANALHACCREPLDARRSVSGCRNAISTWPFRSFDVSSAVGVATFADDVRASRGRRSAAPASA